MISHADILEKIASSSILGDLGLFIGGGFSKSVMNKKETIALSWGDLIYKSLFDLKIDINEVKKEGLSYPELASQICHTLSFKENIDFEEAADKLKTKLAEITNWYPGSQSAKEYGKFLKTINPQWIITTNYDLIIESLLPGLCIPLGPEEQMFVPKKLIPVYHIHGIRTNPKSLVVTQEDYIRLFRPNEYRQSKLSLTLKESTTLFIGYGLGDINVLSAVDWAKNVFKGETNNYPPDIIQVLVLERTPREEVYPDNNGTLIFEVNNLGFFFTQLCNFIMQRKKSEKAKRSNLKEYRHFWNPSSAFIDQFINIETFRKDFLNKLSNGDQLMLSGSFDLISRSLEKVIKQENENNLTIKLLMDLFIYLDINKLPPVIIELLISNLNKIEPVIVKNKEIAHLWINGKTRIPLHNLEELKKISKSLKYTKVLYLLNRELHINNEGMKK